MPRGRINGLFLPHVPPRKQWKRIDGGGRPAKPPEPKPTETMAELQREAIDSANAAALAAASANAMRRLGDKAEAERYAAEARAAFKRRRKAEAALSKAMGARCEVRRAKAPEEKGALASGDVDPHEVEDALEGAEPIADYQATEGL